jgi:Asp-tRNA(Asn)/Glu-tRNA(Gln) amidotransferase A subunit family amidase
MSQAIGPDTLEPITLAAVAFGQSVRGTDVARANATVQTAALAMSRFLDQYDLILSPLLTAPPLPLGWINLDPGVEFMEWGARVGPYAACTQLANVTGQPSMSVPLAMSDDGLPIGVMFSGRYGDEALLYALAGQLERAAPWNGRKPRI